MGGTLTSSFDYRLVLSDQLFGWYIDTLLGPERTRECFFLGENTDPEGFQFIPREFCSWLVLGVAFLGVLFENCTVDASIFVSKCLRAYGGCLGTRSR